jgi:hypothetical protein
MEEPEPRRGTIGLYAGAFVLMIAAGTALVGSSLGSFRSIGLLWVSGGLSVAAIGLALASVLVPRRR